MGSPATLLFYGHGQATHAPWRPCTTLSALEGFRAPLRPRRLVKLIWGKRSGAGRGRVDRNCMP
eukprot:scaffold54855_cov63-Phaeocystis_antarctica.AAC.1